MLAEQVPLRIRIAVWSFLGAFFITGLGGIEAWPLTGWRLFSHLRHERVNSWLAVAVDRGGRESEVPFHALPAGYRWATHVLIGFPSLSPGEQLDVCGAWSEALRGIGRDVHAMRIYRVERTVSQRPGLRGAQPTSRILRFTCVDGEVRAERGPGAPG